MSKKINKVQCDILFARLEEYPEMSSGYSSDQRDNVKQFWKQLAYELNSLGPPEKNESEWKKAWNDQKRYMRRKASLHKTPKGSSEDLREIHNSSSTEEPTEIFSEPLCVTGDDEDQTPLYLKRINRSLELICKQKQTELTEMKRHNLHIEKLKQDSIEQNLKIKRRSLQIKEEKLNLLRQSMARQ